MKTNAEMTGRIIIGIGLFRDREVIKEDCVYGLLYVDLKRPVLLAGVYWGNNSTSL